MWELINWFIPKLTETMINLFELGAITGIGLLFFKGLKFLVSKVSTLVE
jgi:hypothetical protein